MTRTVRIARSTLDEDALESPPAGVWASIAAELGLAGSSDAAPVAVEPDTATAGAELAGSPATPKGASEVGAADSGAAQTRAPETAEAFRTRPAAVPAHAKASRRGIRTVWTLAASLVLVAGVALGTWAVATRLAPTSIAEASLDAFPSHAQAVGMADVEERRDGSRTLIVTLESDTVPDTYREVWLIRNDAAALISLGVLDGDRGSFPIPAGVDLAEYSLVDISVEPIDGDPAHSGDSIVRGELTFA